MKKQETWNPQRLGTHAALRYAAVLFFALACGHAGICGEIHKAVNRGDIAAVKALIREHPDLVESKDEGGSTPLIWAAYSGEKDIAAFLLLNTADVNARNNGEGKTALHFAACMGYKDVVVLLLANKADVNAKSSKGTTPLHLAAYNGQKEVVEVLLANKADVTAKNDSGKTPLGYAVEMGEKEVAELLRQHGGQ